MFFREVRLTTNHSTTVAEEGGALKVQGRLAAAPISTSTSGVTVTVTAPLLTEDREGRTR